MLREVTTDIPHKKWQVTRLETKDGQTKKKFHTIASMFKKRKNHVRVEKEHIKILHHKIATLLHHMNESELIKALGADTVAEKEKKTYLEKENYYFVEIYKFLRAYEHILRYLWKKEHHLGLRRS
jgi:hypothetical protein